MGKRDDSADVANERVRLHVKYCKRLSYDCSSGKTKKERSQMKYWDDLIHSHFQGGGG